MFLQELDAEEKWEKLLADPRSDELLSRVAKETRRENGAN